MDIKTLLIFAGLAFLLMGKGCGEITTVATDGVSIIQSGVSDARAALDADPNAAMNPACLDAAQQQLSPQWGDMNRLQRLAMGVQVVTTCAGTPGSNGGGQ